MNMIFNQDVVCQGDTGLVEPEVIAEFSLEESKKLSKLYSTMLKLCPRTQEGKEAEAAYHQYSDSCNPELSSEFSL